MINSRTILANPTTSGRTCKFDRSVGVSLNLQQDTEHTVAAQPETDDVSELRGTQQHNHPKAVTVTCRGVQYTS